MLVALLVVDENKLLNPAQGKLRKQLNAIKCDKYPFMLEVTKCVPLLAIMQLGDAYKRFFKGESKYPQFRKWPLPSIPYTQAWDILVRQLAEIF